MSDDSPEDPALDDLLSVVKQSRGVDLHGYKRSSLQRRIMRRLQNLGLPDLAAYVDHVRGRPDEVTPLLDTILINVTSFFRDPEAWDFVAREIIPAILAAKGPEAPVRVWSAGCASGEEPFTIAMLLAEALGLEAYTRRVKIYATDWDEGALAVARRARYGHTALERVPDALRTRYFHGEDSDALLHGALRRSVIFGQHDLVEDAPIPRVDLLVCRNTLMYFNLETQPRILGRLHFALAEHGYLFLGRAEMLLSYSASFRPVELKHRIFARQSLEMKLRDRPASPFPPAAPRRREEPPAHDPGRLRDAALDASPVAQVVIDSTGVVGLINQRAATLLRLGPADVGRPLKDLELSYRPVDLRSMIDEAIRERRTITRKSVEHRSEDREPSFLDIAVVPRFLGDSHDATSLTFSDETQHHLLQENLQRFSENLETAYEELQAANEELETTNEELQAANEEMETTNEELQAANEEMETVNEELRSTNDELSGVNEQLRHREDALNEANAFLNTVLGSLRAGVAVIGEDLRVRVWNEVAAELWGLRADEVQGRKLAELDIGLPVRPLIDAMVRMVDESGGRPARTELLLDAVNRRGRSLGCRVVLSRMPRGFCILMEDEATAAAPARREPK